VPDSLVGLRDRAIILTLVLTGRRRSEVLAIQAGDVRIDAGRVTYAYCGKGGKTGQRVMPTPAIEAIQAWLAATARALASMAPDESLAPSTRNGGAGISSGRFCMNLRAYLAAAGLPVSGVLVFGIPLPSYRGTPGNQSRKCPASSTTAAWR
jgi:site-specific recombinase XerD